MDKYKDNEICIVPKDMIQFIQEVMEVRSAKHNTQCVKEMILQEYDGNNITALDKKYDYSEKTVRRIIKDSKKRNSCTLNYDVTGKE